VASIKKAVLQIAEKKKTKRRRRGNWSRTHIPYLNSRFIGVYTVRRGISLGQLGGRSVFENPLHWGSIYIPVDRGGLIQMKDRTLMGVFILKISGANCPLTARYGPLELGLSDWNCNAIERCISVLRGNRQSREMFISIKWAMDSSHMRRDECFFVFRGEFGTTRGLWSKIPYSRIV
jgi:hypothetical protein